VTVALILACIGAGVLMSLALIGGPCASGVTWGSFAFMASIGLLPVASLRHVPPPWWLAPTMFSGLLLFVGLLLLAYREWFRAGAAFAGPVVAFAGAWLRNLFLNRRQ